MRRWKRGVWEVAECGRLDRRRAAYVSCLARKLLCICAFQLHACCRVGQALVLYWRLHARLRPSLFRWLKLSLGRWLPSDPMNPEGKLSSVFIFFLQCGRKCCCHGDAYAFPNPDSACQSDIQMKVEFQQREQDVQPGVKMELPLSSSSKKWQIWNPSSPAAYPLTI